MPEEKVGWIKAARRILAQCRGVVIDDILERKRILLSWLFKWRIGNYLWMIIAMGIFHLKLLHAITYPLHSFLIKGFKTTVYSNGESFSLNKVRAEAVMVIFALSAIWHCFSWPNPISALRWNFSVRPQVNFKPQMSFIARSYSAPQMSSASCLDQIKITRSQSETTQCKMSGKMDLGVNIRLKNIILDSILTVYETIVNFLSLANEFAASMLRSRPKFSHDDCLHLSASDEQLYTGDSHRIELNIEKSEWKNTINDKYNNGNQSKAQKESRTADNTLIVGPYRWLTWRLPKIPVDIE
ncbi:unnamed protein product [Cercopithifilaria johnstoni]|uniref:Uncharacterized protein n=1 Tax=Cercopithifilaria johnstoni TaxID=2874296 RepID=A0A8J2LZC5_9BILA|nr:unnamed protein product [Cercopithifilaria johnstoni]